MEFGKEQQKAIHDVHRWFTTQSKTKQVYRLFGYAGVGKTSIVKHIAEGIGGDVLFATYTGKAALVLRNKGCPNTSTIHQLIYTPTGNNTSTYNELRESMNAFSTELLKNGATTEDLKTHERLIELRALLANEEKEAKRPRFKLNKDSALREASLLVIDECSMLDVPTGEDLESFGVPTLVLGDPAQLPPVRGYGYFINDEPDTLLTEIHRQAADNPIIHLATLARNRQRPPLGTYGESCVINKHELAGRSDAVDADQIICGKNVTRIAGNARMREILGHKGNMPVKGDKLVCLRNLHDMGLLNGGLWDVVSVDAQGERTFQLSVASRDTAETLYAVTSDAVRFHTNGAEEMPFWDTAVARFDFGYMLTVHKCVTPETLVETEFGIQQIGDIAGHGLIATGHGLRPYKNLVSNLPSNCLKFVFDDFSEITTTRDHRCEVIRQGQPVMLKAEEVALNDWVRFRLGSTSDQSTGGLPSARRTDVRQIVYTTPTTVTEDVAELFGLLVADGSFYRQGFRLAKRHKDVVDRFIFLCSSLFGIGCKQYMLGNAYVAEMNSTYLRKWFAEIGGFEPKQKDVPQCIMEAPVAVQLAFMRGLFEDGTVNINKGYGYVTVHSSMPNVVRKVRAMLLRGGMACTSTESRQGSLYLYGPFARRFSESVRFISRFKNDRLDATEWGDGVKSMIPVSDEIVSRIPFNQTTRSLVQNARVTNTISRSKAKQFKEFLPDVDFHNWHYAKVMSITPCLRETVCVEVPDGNRFLQNGLPWGNCQGSQMDNVLVIDESSSFRQDWWRHLYTAITRAAERITIAV